MMHVGDILSTVEGYHDKCGGYLEYSGVFSTVGDIMSTVGFILSTVGDNQCHRDIMMHVRIS